MTNRQIHHIGYVVADLEASIEKWKKITGSEFTPISRFTTENWVDGSQEGPQHHDVRVSFTVQGPPFIELTAIHDGGSHSPYIHSVEQGEGYHHLAFMNDGSPEECIHDLANAGVSPNGMAVDKDDNPLFFFTDKNELGGARLEMCFPGEQLLRREDNGKVLESDLGGNFH